MSATSRIVDAIARIPSVRSETAVFVRMAGPLAVVNMGPGSTVTIPCVGVYRPITGAVVQVEWRNGRPVVVGPAVSLNPVGVITAAGTPQATVAVDGVEYMLYLRDGYSPTLGDQVTINWNTGTIEGKVLGVGVVEVPSEAPPPTVSFSRLVVQADGSGRYKSSWWGSGPWADSSSSGIWTYSTRVQHALAGANISAVDVFLPLEFQSGLASVGLHSYAAIPGGAPTITDLVALPLGGRNGWVSLPSWWGNWLRDNPGGVGVTAPGGAGENRWTGVATDSYSGALRFSGTR